MNTVTIERIDDGLRRIGTPEEIIDSLPRSDAYTDHYQPSYQDARALSEAIHELQQTRGVTTPEHIRQFRRDLGHAALNGFMVLDGSCAEPVRLYTPIHDLAEETLATDGAISDSLLSRILSSRLLRAKRNRGQGVKPRSSATQVVSQADETDHVRAGETVCAYLGDGVNGERVDQREPDPSRMVAMAVQARDLEAMLVGSLGYHLPAAHEALLLPYERAFMAEDAEGRRFLLSADLPWVGARTNDVNGAHVELLRGVENAVGVKISGSSDRAHIRELAQALNPENEEGKLVFMLRMGLEHNERLGEILDAIAEYAPNAVVMYDIHGVTKNVNGEKIRAVPDIVKEIVHLTRACNSHGLRLSGIHVETMGDDAHRECIDKDGDRPTRPGYVDPRLNPKQLRYLLDAIAETVLSQDVLNERVACL